MFPCPSVPSPFPFPFPSRSLINCNFVNASATICDNLVFARDIESRCAISTCYPSSFLPTIYNKHVDFFNDLNKNRCCSLRPRHGLRPGGWCGFGNVSRTMRRIVQIPQVNFDIVIFPGALIVSVGPSGPILVLPFELLTPEDPSGSPGEPWGDARTLGKFDVSIFEFNVFTFERIFANLRQATTTTSTRSTTTSTAFSARSLPPGGSAASGGDLRVSLGGGCCYCCCCCCCCLLACCLFSVFACACARVFMLHFINVY